jgi:hypothetical protein
MIEAAGANDLELRTVFERFAMGGAIQQQAHGEQGVLVGKERRGAVDFNEWSELLYAVGLLPSKVDAESSSMPWPELAEAHPARSQLRAASH